MSKRYDAADIEVLSGLEPVRRRPGMYTDTSRPNHLAHEVVDNSVDEALAGHCKKIEVVIHTDGSVEVSDDGRGMPVDIHPKEKIPGVELILTRLHAGGKFNKENYQYSGGLHGVGVSVVNALSKNLEVWIRRGGVEYNMSFVNGKKRGKLEKVGKVGKANTGTTIRFWPDKQYFDTEKISVKRLKHVLRAKAVLCPGLTVKLNVAKPKEKVEWCYSGGLEEYLLEAMGKVEHIPAEPFAGSMSAKHEAVDWALTWQTQPTQAVVESYVNLVPTPQGGTHVNGLRTGLTNAIREFCEFRSLLPRARISGVCRRRDQGRLCPVAQSAPGIRRCHRPACDLESADPGQGGKESRPQESRVRASAARQAGRLHLAGTRALRTVPGRGRLRGRLGETGA
jgi:topoisomerase-4 subunit B